MSKTKCYGMRHRGFGDCFNIFAAGHIFSKITGEPTHLYCWDADAELSRYFDGVIWHDWSNLQDFEAVDTGCEPGQLYPRYNGISWHLRIMLGTDIVPKSEIEMNIGRDPHPEAISVIPKGGINGYMGVKTMEAMLARSRFLYPGYSYRFIGHRSDVSQYKTLIDEYKIADEFTEDRTTHVVISQLRKSALLIAPHTGPCFPAIGLQVPVYCERSKNPLHDWLLDVGPGRLTFFNRQ